MPFYEYQCRNCGHTLEAMQKINDSPLKKCPDCGKSQLTRLMSAPVFRLKGAGWYETDFKGDADNKKNLADRPEAEPAKDDKAPAADAKAGDGAASDATKPGDKADQSDKAEKSAKVEKFDKPEKPDKTDKGDKGDKGGKAEKAADKPAAKAAPVESKKPAGAMMSKRGATAPVKAKPKKVVNKAKARAKSRR